MPIAVIFACSLQHAASTAEVDWDWTRTGQAKFTSHLGEEVHYVEDGPGSVHGWARGTHVYLAHGWKNRRDAKAIEKMIADRCLIRCDPKMKPHANPA